MLHSCIAGNNLWYSVVFCPNQKCTTNAKHRFAASFFTIWRKRAGKRGLWRVSVPQTPSASLRHPSSSHCNDWLRHRSRKTLIYRTVFRWCSNGSRFVWNDIRPFLSNRPRCLRQYKQKQTRLNRDGAHFYPERTRFKLRACLDAMLLPQSC